MQGADAALEAENLKTTADAVAVLTPKERESVADQVHKPSRSWPEKDVQEAVDSTLPLREGRKMRSIFRGGENLR